VDVIHKAATFNHWYCVSAYVSGIIVYEVLFNFQFHLMETSYSPLYECDLYVTLKATSSAA